MDIKAKHGCRKTSMAIAVAMSLSIAPAYADDLDDLFELDLAALDAVVVKVSVASLFEEQELQVGSSTAVIRRDDWERRGARRLTDAISNQPSVMILPTWGGADAIAIRGFANELSVRGVATILDGVPLNTLAYGSAQYDKPDIGLGTLDRIEMIRGPGSAIYGSDAFHGVLALHSFESDEDVNEYTAVGGSRGYASGSARISHGLTDTLRLNFSAAISGQPDQERGYEYTEPTFLLSPVPSSSFPGVPNPAVGSPGKGERNYEYESQTASLKLVADPAGPWKGRAGLHMNKYDSHKFTSLSNHVDVFGESVLRDQEHGGIDAMFYMGNFGATRELPENIEMELSGFYWTNHHEVHVRNFLPFPNRTFLGFDENRRGLKLTFKQPDNVWNTQWAAAIGWNRSEIDHRNSDLNFPAGSLYCASISSPGPCTLSPASELNSREILSSFLQAKTSLANDKLHIIYGGRIDHYSDSGLGTVKTPRAGVIFQPRPDTAFKLLYGNSFRAPVASELTDAIALQGNKEIEPETMDSFELVAQRQGKHWKTELVYFESRWKDRINTEPCTTSAPCTTPGASQRYVNQGINTSHGVELIAKWSKQNSKADFSYSYISSEDKKQGFDYVAFPKHILNAGAGYTFKEPGISLYVNNRIHYKTAEGKVFPGALKNDNSTNPPDLPHYWKVDLNVSKQVNNDVEFFVDFRNLLDRRNYHPSIWNLENGLRDEQFNVSAGIRLNL